MSQEDGNPLKTAIMHSQAEKFNDCLRLVRKRNHVRFFFLLSEHSMATEYMISISPLSGVSSESYTS